MLKAVTILVLLLGGGIPVEAEFSAEKFTTANIIDSEFEPVQTLQKKTSEISCTARYWIIYFKKLIA